MNHPHYEIIALDSHVHFYRSWDISLDALLDVAFSNITNHTGSNNNPTLLPAIFLLETSHDNNVSIDRQISEHISSVAKTWMITQNEKEPYSFWATRGDDTLLIITGNQVVTSEGLEVLVVGATAHAKEGMGIDSIVDDPSEETLNIIPWAVGKWLGKRGRLVTGLLSSAESKDSGYVLGDNSGRPWLWKNISQFHTAENTGKKVLAGSDPLPLKGEHIRSGCYGSLIKVDVDPEKPLASIIDAVSSNENIQHFGRLSTINRFMVNQLKLRLQ